MPCFESLGHSFIDSFRGPLVEPSFNIMDDIIEKDRDRLTVENYETIAIVNPTLRKKNVKLN